MLTPDIIKAYNAVRTAADKSVLCHAPFTSINFDQFGSMTACCYNKKEVLGRVPHQTIKEAWLSPTAEQLRARMRNNDLGGGCSYCQELLLAGNHRGTKAYFYDEFAEAPATGWDKVMALFTTKKVGFPKVFELELSNTCNLECIMCNGHFSSSIKKNREHLPAQLIPYGPAFVDELAEFMPYLTDMKFLGGEPFLIDIYYDIWERIIAVNPKIKVHITTNGTVLNNRGKKILEQLNVAIVLSIDSLDKETYEGIRINAKYDRLMENLAFFKTLVQQKKTYLTFTVCPIIQNWKTLPQLLQVANEDGINLHFNTVWAPEQVSMQYLDADTLAEVITYLEAHLPNNVTDRKAANNIQVYQQYIDTLKYWLEEKKQQLPDLERFKHVSLNAENILPILPADSLLSATVLCWYAQLMQHGKGESLAAQLPNGKKILELLSLPTMPEAITQLRLQTTSWQFIMQYMEMLGVLDKLLEQEGNGLLPQRIALVMPILIRSAKQDQAANDLAVNGAFLQLRVLKQPSEKAVVDLYESLFG